MNQVQRFCSSVMLVAVISGCLLWGRVMAQSTSPSLALPVGLPATVAQRVTVPMNFRPGGAAVGSLIFSIDFDESCLGFDASDQNNDGLLDSVRFTLPAAFQGSVAYAATDTEDACQQSGEYSDDDHTPRRHRVEAYDKSGRTNEAM